jgi:indolepyruvate ferredoxin oxidoreductase beta subunit
MKRNAEIGLFTKSSSLTNKARITMTTAVRQQILISGVGGQGVLFVTRLLAEAAILRGFPVFTCETHGMAQRGGTVVSHLKVGEFSSPLIRAGHADGLLVLKAENVAQHSVFLKPGGWVVVNARDGERFSLPGSVFCLDADRLAQQTGNIKSLNLIMLGFALAASEKKQPPSGRLYGTLNDIARAVESGFGRKAAQATGFLQAIRAGYDALAVS